MAVRDIERTVEKENAVLAIFRQLLDNPALGVDDNFFEAGGSSLLASRLATRLRASGILDVPTAAIFAAPTARALSRYSDGGEPPQLFEVPAAADPGSMSAGSSRGARQRAAFARLRPTTATSQENSR